MYQNFVFDVDNTLYSSSCGVEDESDDLCIKFFVEQLKMGKDDAVQTIGNLRKKYGYESSVMDKIYGVSEKEYLEYICDTRVDKISSNFELNELLIKAPQQKFILTDAPKSHAVKVLRKLGISEGVFTDIFDPEAAGFTYKYQDEMFERFFTSNKIDPKQSVFFDDKENNLKQGKKFGITTVLISGTPEEGVGHIDYRFNNINNALKFFVK